MDHYEELFPYSQLNPKLDTKEAKNARIALLEKQLKELEEQQYELDEALVTELEQQITEDCEKSLFAFYQESWPVFEVGDFIPNWHMEAICEALEAVESGQIDNLILQIPPGGGKKLEKSTPILTANRGWTSHGDLKVGDDLYHTSGKTTQVLQVHPSSQDIDYRVTFTGGETIECHVGHLWEVYSRNKHMWIVESIENLYKDYQRIEIDPRDRSKTKVRNVFSLRNIKPLEYLTKELPLNPYFFGLWLGDGSSDSPIITHDVKDSESISKIESDGYKLISRYTHKTTGVITSRFTNQGLIKKIRDFSLYKNKHIPKIYLESSIEQRLELLAGLIDSDGNVTEDGKVCFANCNKCLIDNVFELCTGLGLRPNLREIQPKKSTSGIQGKQIVYRIYFTPNLDIPTQLPRKKITHIIEKRRRYITKIEKLEIPKIGNCITVSSEDGMYLCGKTLIPTHNSSLSCVAFPAWLWLKDPSLRFISAAVDMSLVLRDSVRTRTVIQSEWYQSKWAEKYSLVKGSNQKSFYETNENGYRYATSISAGVVGRRYDILLCLPYEETILTNIGPLPIGEIVEKELPVKVATLNYKTNEIEWSGIGSYQKNPFRPLVRITTEKGSVITCTEDHRIFETTTNSYVEAKNLVPKINKLKTYKNVNRSYLQPNDLQENILKGSKRFEEIKKSLLFSKVFSGIQENFTKEKDYKALLDLPKRNICNSFYYRQVRVLLKKLSRVLSEKKQICVYRQLSSMFRKISSTFLSAKVLFSYLCGQESPGKYVRGEKFKLQEWGVYKSLFPLLSEVFTRKHKSQRPELLPTLWANRIRSWYKNALSPYRLQQAKRLFRKFNIPVSILSWQNAWGGRVPQELEPDPIISVERLSREEEFTYNICVTPHHNYLVVTGDVASVVKNCDDPHNPKEIVNKAAKDSVWKWWNETVSTRSSSRGKRVVIHQRLACDDLIGRILETDDCWEVMSFPMEYEANVFYSWSETNLLPNRDPRTEEGELLFPQVKTPRIVKAEKKQLGTYGTAAQHQQRPIPLDGGLIKKNCFNHYQIGSKQTFFSRSQQTVGTWDLSFGDSGGSYCVGMVWSQQDGYKKYAVDAYRGKWDWTQQMANVVQMLNDYPQIRTLLIEKKANGDGIISALRKQIAAGITRPVNIIPVEVNKSKEVRIYMCLSDFEAGNVYIPNPANCDWSGDFVQELTTFPVGANDDYTDNASMFLNWIATSSQNFKSVTFTDSDIKNLHSGNNSQVQTNSYFSDSKGKPLFNISRGYAKDIFS
jgi:predicted phage terminase large subunit-like protein